MKKITEQLYIENVLACVLTLMMFVMLVVTKKQQVQIAKNQHIQDSFATKTVQDHSYTSYK